MDKVLRHRERGGKQQFLVRWKGYDSSWDSWEPVVEFLPMYNEAFAEYVREHGLIVDLSKHLGVHCLWAGN